MLVTHGIIQKHEPVTYNILNSILRGYEIPQKYDILSSTIFKRQSGALPPPSCRINTHYHYEKEMNP